MSNENKQLREVASCVRTLLKTAHGHALRVKEIMSMIDGEDLDNPVALTQKVVNDLAARPAAVVSPTPSSERRQAIASFFVQNNDLLEQNPIIRDGLLHLYSMGRYSKAERAVLKDELLGRLSGDTPEAPAATEEGEEPTTQYNF